MPNTGEDEVIRKLQERVASGELSGIDVSYRLTGGAPGEQLLEEELRVSGRGPVQARLRMAAGAPQESSERLAIPELTILLREIGEGVGELIPRSEARFVPDSIVGQVSLKVEGQEASFFFLPDQEQAKQQGKVLSSRAARSVNALDRLRTRILPR
jgi:hypothetical protein